MWLVHSHLCNAVLHVSVDKQDSTSDGDDETLRKVTELQNKLNDVSAVW